VEEVVDQVAVLAVEEVMEEQVIQRTISNN
jgi:hypothetical protein